MRFEKTIKGKQKTNFWQHIKAFIVMRNVVKYVLHAKNMSGKEQFSLNFYPIGKTKQSYTIIYVMRFIKNYMDDIHYYYLLL